MTAFFIVVLFGVVGIACLFLIFTWGRAAQAADMRLNYRYRVVAWSLCSVSAGLAMAVVNRISVDLFQYKMAPVFFFAEAVFIIVGQMALLGSTALGEDPSRNRVWWFGACSVIWTVFCAFWVF